ncbi:MAG: hypothetical protein Q7T05_03985 [Dehalococcoidia bacterium]|nr:hypothetical protein [Dehalococcoidia bacterium]
MIQFKTIRLKLKVFGWMVPITLVDKDIRRILALLLGQERLDDVIAFLQQLAKAGF